MVNKLICLFILIIFSMYWSYICFLWRWRRYMCEKLIFHHFNDIQLNESEKRTQRAVKVSHNCISSRETDNPLRAKAQTHKIIYVSHYRTLTHKTQYIICTHTRDNTAKHACIGLTILLHHPGTSFRITPTVMNKRRNIILSGQKVWVGGFSPTHIHPFDAKTPSYRILRGE